MTDEDLKYLQDKMSLTRLANMGLFQRLDTDDPLEIKREIKLHRAVLDKALVDLFSTLPKIKKDVEDWLSLTNLDFIEACERADLEPESVYKIFNLMRDSILIGDHAKFKSARKK